MTTDVSENLVALRPVVNGSAIAQYIGKTVTLIGEAILVNNSGTSFDIKTPDMNIVTISLRKPLKEPVAGLVEVHGIVRGKNNIVCDYYICYPKELAETYDPEILNEVVKIVQNLPTVWTEE